MTNTFRRLTIAAAACALAAGCASPQPPPARHAATNRPPAPTARSTLPERPIVADHALAAQASAFEGFIRRAKGIDPAFSASGDVAQALQTAAGHDPQQLEAGMIAYAAMAALQEPRFVSAVRAERDHADLARRLSADPRAALALTGADAAGARASGALFAQGSALSGEGEKVKRVSYSIQHQAWSKAPATDHAGELARVKRISATGYAIGREDSAGLQSALAQGGHRPGAASPAVMRGVALAALSVLGEEARGRSLMSEPKTGSCLHMAKLNLYQCLASAGPRYEDIYCLGQHAMIDPGQCLVDATKAPRQVANR